MNIAWLLIFGLSAASGWQTWWENLHLFSSPASNYWQGYIEGELIWLSPLTVSGQLKQVNVKQGQSVQAGELLFSVVDENEQLNMQQADAKLRAAQAKLADAKKGQRPLELAEIQARIAQTEADLAFALTELKRSETLYKKQMIQQEIVDSQASTVQKNRSRLAELQAQLQVAQLGGRVDALQALQAEVETAQKAVEQAQWRLTQTQVNAPQTGKIVEVVHYTGEWVNAGSPVLALLPPQQLKLRFFVPESALGSLQTGRSVQFECDSCAKNLVATISYISPKAEYTPPVIYSQQTRTKLVYMIEARPAPAIAEKLNVGQPVSVWLPSAE